MIKQKNKKTVTDVDTVYVNVSHDEMNTIPHATNTATELDTENKTSVIQLLHG